MSISSCPIKPTGKTFRRNRQNNSSSRVGKSSFTLLENTHTNPGSKNFSVPINLHPHHSQVKRRLLIRQFSWLQFNIYLRLPRMNSQWHNYADKLPVTVAGPRRLIPASLLSLPTPDSIVIKNYSQYTIRQARFYHSPQAVSSVTGHLRASFPKTPE